MTGSQQASHDSGFIAAATPSTVVTVFSDSTAQIENEGVNVHAQPLLNLMYEALQSSSDATTPISDPVSLGLIPIPLLPGSNAYLDQVSSDGVTANGNIVHTNLHVSYGTDYGLILEQLNGGFNLILTHSAIEAQNIQEIIANTHDEGVEGDGLHEEVSFTAFIPTAIMLALTGLQNTESQPNLATVTTGAALLLTAAMKPQQ